MSETDVHRAIYEELHSRPVDIDKLDQLFDASVLLPIVETEEGPAVLFTVRAKTLRRQPGEICFPGGHVECSDGGYLRAAIRETCEELGTTEENIQILGDLDIFVTHGGPILHPFVGVLKEYKNLNFSRAEVDSLLIVPLKALLEQKPFVCEMDLADHPGEDFPFDLVPQRIRVWRKRKRYHVYFYQYGGQVIWGMTARILFGFLERNKKKLAQLLNAKLPEEKEELDG